MNEIVLSGTDWKNCGDFWDAFLAAVGAPKWHGRNLDALSDSIGRGSINAIEAPYRIVIRDVDDLPMSVSFLLCQISKLFDELRTEGILVELICPDRNSFG